MLFFFCFSFALHHFSEGNYHTALLLFYVAFHLYRLS